MTGGTVQVSYPNLDSTVGGLKNMSLICVQVTTETFGGHSHSSVPDTSRETESEMEIRMTSDVTHQLLTTSPS